MNIIESFVEFFAFSSDERLARKIVRSYFKGMDVLFKEPSKGTVRFDVRSKRRFIGYNLERQGFYRVRDHKDRPLSGQSIDSFDQIHFGKVTVAVESDKGRSVWNFAQNAR